MDYGKKIMQGNIYLNYSLLDLLHLGCAPNRLNMILVECTTAVSIVQLSSPASDII